SGLDLCQLSGETRIVAFLFQLPIQTRRGNFQRIREWNQVLYIENRPHLFADQLAVPMGYPSRFINENSQDRILASTFKLHVDKLITLPFNYVLHQLSNSIPFHSHVHTTKKWAKRPLRLKPTFQSIGFDMREINGLVTMRFSRIRSDL